jgi:hypothetical protein
MHISARTAGPGFIVLSNIAFVLTLAFLQAASHGGRPQILILACANVILAAPILIHQTCVSSLQAKSVERIFILIWSIAYGIDYSIFAIFPKTGRLKDEVQHRGNAFGGGT